jgi:hypothetical protein
LRTPVVSSLAEVVCPIWVADVRLGTAEDVVPPVRLQHKDH